MADRYLFSTEICCVNLGRITPRLKLVEYDICIYNVHKTKGIIADILRYHSTFIGEIIVFCKATILTAL